MADPPDSRPAGLHSSPSRYRSDIRAQKFVAVRASLGEMVSNSATTPRPLHRPRPAARAFPQSKLNLRNLTFVLPASGGYDQPCSLTSTASARRTIGFVHIFIAHRCSRASD